MSGVLRSFLIVAVIVNCLSIPMAASAAGAPGPVMIPLTGSVDLPVKPGPEQKAMMDLLGNRAELLGLIKGVLDMEGKRGLAIIPVQAKRLLPLAKRVSGRDLLGVMDSGTAGVPKDRTKLEALRDEVESCLLSMEDCLSPIQLGHVDEIAGIGPAAAPQGSVMIRSSGPMKGLAGGGGSAPSPKDMEKLKKEAEESLKRTNDETKAVLERFISLLRKRSVD